MRLYNIFLMLFLCSITACTQTQCTRGDATDTDKSKGGLGAHLITSGDWCLGLGILCLVVGLALRFSGSSGFLTRLATSFGCAGIAVGSSLIWFGEHPWIIGVTAGLSLVALALHHRDDLRKWLHIGVVADAQSAAQPTEIAPSPIQLKG